MKKQDAVLSLKPEAVEAVEKIIAARKRQGTPFDRDTVLSGIINTYASQMLQAVEVSDQFRPIAIDPAVGEQTNFGGSNRPQ